MLLNNLLNKYDVILASQSPRRSQLLQAMGINFRVSANPNIDESYNSTLHPAEIACRIAQKKANDNTIMFHPNSLIIAADTIVCVNDTIYGKPKNYHEAFNTLSALSGKEHTVITGICIKTAKNLILDSETSYVYFNQLSNDDIAYYINNYKPFDKAGAYGIQEWIGYTSIAKINGCFYNIMGLPTALLYKQLNLISRMENG